MQEIGIAKAQKPLQRIVVVALGWVLMIGGIVGLFLPFVPGAVLIVAGALMLRPQRACLRRALARGMSSAISSSRTRLWAVLCLWRELAQPL
jgi:uncharacterized membrane protein YbaN (DUF454 family)